MISRKRKVKSRKENNNMIDWMENYPLYKIEHMCYNTKGGE